MEAQTESVRHSNRPLAAVVGAIAVAIVGYLFATRPAPPEEAVPAPTIPEPTTTVTTLPPSTSSTPAPGFWGASWWESELEPSETNARVRSLDEGVEVLLTDTAEGPTIRRIDLIGQEVLWQSSARRINTWRDVDPILVDGTIMMPDQPVQPEFETSLLWGFDLETGDVQWAVRYRTDVVITDSAFATVVNVLSLRRGDEQIALIRSGDRQLQRIDPQNGNTMWSTELPPGAVIENRPATRIVVRDDDTILALDHTTGEVVGEAFSPVPETPATIEALIEGSSAGLQWDLDDGSTLWTWSFPADVGRAPGIALVNGQGEIDWNSEGRPDSTWRDDLGFVVDGVAVWVDDSMVGDNRATFGFDIATGERLWTSKFGIPANAQRGVDVSALRTRSGSHMVLVRVIGGELVRVSPSTGTPVWSVEVPPGRILGSIRRTNGSEAVVVQTDSGPLYLDVDTGAPGPL